MTEEDVKIQALRAALHDRDTEEGSVWEKLAAGEMSEAEHADLRRKVEESEEARRLYELYRPFDDAERERIFVGVQARVRKQTPKVGTLRRSWMPVAAAAGVALFAGVAVQRWVWGPHVEVAEQRPAPGPHVEVAESRPLGPKSSRVTQLDLPDAKFEMTVVPRKQIDERLLIRKALLLHDGKTIPWDAHPNPTSPDNEITIVGKKKDLFPCLPSGDWTVLLAVGVAGPAPSDADMVRQAGAGSQGSYQVVSKQLWLGSPTPSDGTPCP